MDYEKYYMVGNDGCYHLHFFDTKGLSFDEIRKIFSSYGNVVTIKFGEKTGLRFVKYKNLDETIRCLQGLQNGEIIQLLPQKNKINDSIKKVDQNSSQQQTAKMETSSQKMFRPNKQFNPISVHDERMSDISKGSTHNVKMFNADNTGYFSDTNSRNSTHSYKNNPKVITHDKSDSLISNEKYSLPSKQQNFVDYNHSNVDSNDYEKYYRISRDGTYTIHFPNRKGLSTEEIKELFSSYGNVMSIYNGGDNNGLRFVRYKTLDEIKNCVKGLQNSKVINILPQKDKINIIKKTDQKSLNQKQIARTENLAENTFDTDKKLDSSSIYNEKSSEVEEKRTCNTKPEWDNGFDNVSNSRSSKYNYNTGISETNHNESKLPISKENYPLLSRQENSTYNKVFDKIEMKKMEFNFSSISDTNIRVRGDISNDNKIPALISDIEIKQKEFDTISNSSLSVENKNITIKIIRMQEVIVANIHENYGVHYILHLFEKYNPISAKFVSTSETNNIRYCHVYFKTIEDAVAAEEEFDNFNLSGKNLIVLRQSQLIKEAYYK